VDATGRIFFANSGVDTPGDFTDNTVRRIDPNGSVTTIAGGSATQCTEPCPALQQRLDPTSDVILTDGIFAVTDEHVKQIFSGAAFGSNPRLSPSPCTSGGNQAGDTAAMATPVLLLAFFGGWRWRRRRFRIRDDD
jgi:MYXO-CTERM domain-containing protein